LDLTEVEYSVHTVDAL